MAKTSSAILRFFVWHIKFITDSVCPADFQHTAKGLTQIMTQQNTHHAQTGSLATFFAPLLVAALACILVATAAKAADDTREVAARVNGAPIYMDQVTPLVESQLQRNPRIAEQARGEALLHDMHMRALNQLIDVELLYQAGSEIEIPDAQEQIEAYVDHYRANNLTANLSEEQMHAAAHRQVQVNAYYLSRDLDDPEVPEERIRAFFEQNKQDFTQQPSIEVRHILIKADPDGPDEDTAKARGRMQEALDRLNQGEDFSKVAQDLSECASAAEGGHLGHVERGSMPPEFIDAGFSLPVGDLSRVVQTRFGFHVLQVLDKNPGGAPSYEDMRDFYRTFLQKQVREELLAQEFALLRERAEIEIYLPQRATTPMRGTR